MLFRHTPTQLVEDMNRLNDAVANVSDLIFDDVRPTTPDEQALKGRDTTARVLGNGQKYYGAKRIYFNRLKLQTAFANQLIKLTFLKPFNSLYEQFNAINEEFSSVFTKEDLLDAVPEDPSADFGIITLTANPTSLGWQGTVDIAYETIEPEIVQIPDTELDGVMTPNERTDVAQASLLYTAYDFNVDSVWLEGLPAQALSGGDLLRLRDALMVKRPDIDWAVVGAAPYSLEGTTLAYLGTDPEYIVNKLYKQVAVFKLGTTSTAVEGYLFLHYSKEGDDDV